MIRRFLLTLALVLPTVVGSLAHAATETFTDTVRVVMGSRESQDEVRVYATQEAKRRVLDKVGVYLSGSTEIVRKVEESFGGGGVGRTAVRPTDSFSDSTSVLTRIQTLTVGVVQTEVVSEEWKSEGGAFVLTLVCRVTVDREDALEKLTELLKDKQKVEDYQKVQEEVERLRGDLAQLRLDLESAKTEKEKVAVKEEVQTAINGLTVRDWFEKGLAATNLDDRIACHTFAIQLDPSVDGPLVHRGLAYFLKGEWDMALADFSRALLLAPDYADLYVARGEVYYKKGDFLRAIEQFDRALQIDPSQASTYDCRGVAYFNLKDYYRANADYSRALQIDPTKTECYNNRAVTYVALADYDNAIEDANSALQIDSSNGRAYWIRGLAYEEKGNMKSARRDYQRAADLGNESGRRFLEMLK